MVRSSCGLWGDVASRLVPLLSCLVRGHRFWAVSAIIRPSVCYPVICCSLKLDFAVFQLLCCQAVKKLV